MGELVLTAGQLVPHVLEAGEKATVHLLQGRHLALPARQPSLNSQQRRSMLITSLLPRPLLLAPLQTSSSSDVSQQTLPSSLQHQSTGVLVHSLRLSSDYVIDEPAGCILEQPCMADKTPDTAVHGCIYLMMIPPILGSYVAPASAMGDSKTMSWWRMT